MHIFAMVILILGLYIHETVGGSIIEQTWDLRKCIDSWYFVNLSTTMVEIIMPWLHVFNTYILDTYMAL